MLNAVSALEQSGTYRPQQMTRQQPPPVIPIQYWPAGVRNDGLQYGQRMSSQDHPPAMITQENLHTNRFLEVNQHRQSTVVIISTNSNR